MLVCSSSTFHGPAPLHCHSQPSNFLLSKPILFPPRSRFTPFGKFKFRSLLSGKRNLQRFGVRASLDSESILDVAGPHIAQQPYSVKIPVGDRHVSLISFFCFWNLSILFLKCLWLVWRLSCGFNSNVFERWVTYTSDWLIWFLCYCFKVNKASYQMLFWGFSRDGLVEKVRNY